MTTLCVISARGGSQGLPGKNIRLLLGKPLIVWSIEQALATPELNRIVVSTDSKEIAAIAEKAGAEVPFIRPAELAGPEVGKFQVWQHALSACEEHYRESYKCLVDLDCTNPLRDPEDISNAMTQFRDSKHRGVDAVFTVCKARKNPYFNMVEPDGTGALVIFHFFGDPSIRGQSAPPVYDHVG